MLGRRRDGLESTSVHLPRGGRAQVLTKWRWRKSRGIPSTLARRPPPNVPLHIQHTESQPSDEAVAQGVAPLGLLHCVPHLRVVGRAAFRLVPTLHFTKLTFRRPLARLRPPHVQRPYRSWCVRQGREIFVADRAMRSLVRRDCCARVDRRPQKSSGVHVKNNFIYE